MPRRGEKDWLQLASSCPETQRWYRARLARSRDSANNHARNLFRALHEVKGMEPPALLKMSQEDLDDMAQDIVEHYQGRKLTGSTIAKYLDSIRSFLAWHRLEIHRVPFIPGANENPNAEAQEIPAQKAMGLLLDVCDSRTAVIATLEAFAGVRPQVLGKSDGSDGLRLGDFPELKITGETVEFEKVPTLIAVRKEISKTRAAYITFLGPQGCDVLLAELRTRLTNGEKLGPDSPVVTTLWGEPRFLQRGNIQDSLRVRMRRVNLKSTTYILRSYFDNRLVVAEAEGVPAIYRDFWMGHKGNLQTRYALRKKLPPDVIESMRTAYTKALPYLETRNHASQEEDPVQRIAVAALKGAGHTAEEIAKLDLEGMDETALVNIMTDALAKRLSIAGAAIPKPAKVKQRVVSDDDLPGMLDAGWTFKASLEGGKAIIEQAA